MAAMQRISGYISGWLAPKRKGERRFNKAFPGGWAARFALLAIGVLVLGLGRASSWQSALSGSALAVAFYGSLMVLGRMNNYVSLGETQLTDSQMGIVTPGGPTYAGGKIAYGSILSVNLNDREVRIRYSGRDWRRRPTTRLQKFKVEEPQEFAELLVEAVNLATGHNLWVGREP